jgi:peptidoglycan/LPS O-acetylase OafA/YrhL
MPGEANTSKALHKPVRGRSRYRPEIDGLRAFAVVAVIINHVNKDLLPSGYLGVDIFFVISGYVITSSLAGRESKNFLDFLTGFYERRIKRLVPALVVFVLVTSVLISVFNPDPGGMLRVGWKSLFGISNISLYRSSVDYFAQSTELNPFTHTWSLGVEEQFYLLFPFLIWFSGFGQQTAKGARNLFFCVGALTIASLVGFISLYQVNQPAAYFLMPPRFWEMAAGCLLFIGFQKRARMEQALEQVPPLFVVAGMVGVMFLPVSAAVPATMSIVLLTVVLIACLKPGSAAYRFFTLEKVVFVGLISYSLYLWHWTVLSISRWTLGIHWWSAPIQVALMVLLAIGSYRYVETPLRNSTWSTKRWKTVLAGVALATLAAIFNEILGRFIAPYLSIGSHSIPIKYRQYKGIEKSFGAGICNIFSETTKATRLSAQCGVHASDVARTIYNIGDSHAERFAPYVNLFARRKGVNAINVWGNSCLFPQAVHSEYRHLAMRGKDCYGLSGVLQRQLEQKMARGDVLLISVFSVANKFVHRHRFEGLEDVFRDQAGRDITPKQAIGIYFKSMSALATKAREKGVLVIFYLNATRFDDSGFGDHCGGTHDWATQWLPRNSVSKTSKCKSSTQEFKDDVRVKLAEGIAYLKRQNPEVVFADALNGDACDEDYCDGSYYSDSQHMHYWYASGFISQFLR